MKEDESCYLEFFGSAEPCGGLGHLSLGWDLERAELFHVVRKRRTAVSWDSLRRKYRVDLERESKRGTQRSRMVSGCTLSCMNPYDHRIPPKRLGMLGLSGFLMETGGRARCCVQTEVGRTCKYNT